MRTLTVAVAGMTGMLTVAACAASGGGGGRPAPTPRPAPMAAGIADGHTKNSVTYAASTGTEALDVLFGPLKGSTIAPRAIGVDASNADVRARFDRGYAFLITTAEIHRSSAADARVLIPVYPKVLKSTAIEISTPGSKLIVQVLDNWEAAQPGEVCQRAYLRNQDTDNSTHKATVYKLRTDGTRDGAGVELIEDPTTTQPNAGEGQYVELIKENSGYSLSAAKDIKNAPADIAAFLKWADENAGNSGMAP